jgi:hypothetical protein
MYDHTNIIGTNLCGYYFTVCYIYYTDYINYDDSIVSASILKSSPYL